MADKDNRQHLMLIDGYGLIYRSYFAFINRPLTDSEGTNVSAVFGFFRSLFSLIQEHRPERIVVAMDSRVPTFRHELYAEYKAQRDRTPEDLHEQIPVIESILDKTGIQRLSIDGYEADDVIATVATDCASAGYACTIVSNDKDLLQLVDDEGRITALRYEKNMYVTYTAETVRQRFSVSPEQIVDYLSIVGDSSDNIPGIKGIGEKGAVQLLQQFCSFEGIKAGLPELTGAKRKKIEEGFEAVRLSRDLVTLRYIEALGSTQPGTEVDHIRWDQAVEDFDRIGAKSLIQQTGESRRQEPQAEQGVYTGVTSTEELTRVIEQVKKAGCFAFDVETDNIDEMHARLAGCSIALEAGRAWYIPLICQGAEMLPEDQLKASLKSVLEDESLTCIGQNLKYDMKVLHRWGITVRCSIFDTMIAAWLLDSGSGSYGMDALAERYLGYRPIPYSDVVEKGGTFTDVPFDRAVTYAAEDADVTFRLYEVFAQLLKEQQLERVMYELEMPVEMLLAEMELAGITLLPDKLKEYSRELEGQLSEIESQVFDLCGREFNIHSTKQLQQVLFEQRGLTPVKKTKTGFSTDTSVLEALADQDEVPRLILDHRVLAKLKSTYVDTLPELIHPETGRIHTSYTQTGTATGRLSSRNPNLQNIPIRTEAGRRIRKAFVPRPGCRFVSADYAQIELVILAHLADDPGLKEAFVKGLDVHSHTASLIFQTPLEEITSQQRRVAKTINFGVMYGMSSFRLSRELGIPRNQADQFIEAYFARYSGIRQFIDTVVKEAEESGSVKTLMGRVRRIPAITSKNRMERLGAQRVAVNTPIQGTAADIMKLAMVRIARRLETEALESAMLLQIHDEIILEVPDAEVPRVKQLLQEEMEQTVELSVPLHVSIEEGMSWGDMH